MKRSPRKLRGSNGFPVGILNFHDKKSNFLFTVLAYQRQCCQLRYWFVILKAGFKPCIDAEIRTHNGVFITSFVYGITDRKGFGGYVFRSRARVLLNLYGIRFKETIEEKTGTSNVFPERIFLLLKQKCA